MIIAIYEPPVSDLYDDKKLIAVFEKDVEVNKICETLGLREAIILYVKDIDLKQFKEMIKSHKEFKRKIYEEIAKIKPS